MRIPRVALALFLSLFAQVAWAQQAYTSVAGPWWITIGGKDKGSILIEFTAPKAGGFDVADVALTEHPSFGFSRSLGAFFRIDAGESLEFDANRMITGELQLSDPNTGDPLGTLIIEKGKPDKTFTTLKLRGSIACNDPALCSGSSPVVVKLKGVRPPSAFPVLSGRTSQGSLKGKGVKSKAMDLAVKTDGTLGLPAYTWTASGPAQIDGDPDNTVELDGRVMLNPGFKAQGLLENADVFDPALANGKLRLPDPNSLIPKFGVVAQNDRKLKVKGQLIEPAEPILQVTPNGTVDFGAVRLDATSTKTFAVANIGTDELKGTVSPVLGGSLDFELGAVTSYDALTATDQPVQIEVTFAPSSQGPKSASFRFSVDGGAGAQVVQVTGSGGVSEITVDPDPIALPDTSISATTASSIDVTVTNDGDIPLVGQASLGTSLVFLLSGATSYTLQPGDNQVLTIKFKPTAAVTSNTTLTLTGASAGNKTVNVTGTGTSP